MLSHTGGAGADTLTGGDGDDDFEITTGITTDTITDFTVNSDDLEFDLSKLNAASAITDGETDTLITFDDGQAAPTGTSPVTAVKVATIDDDASDATTIDDANFIILHGGNTQFADVATAVNAFEASGDFTITHENDIADDDTFIFAYENSTTNAVTIAAASFEGADGNDGTAATIADDALKGTDLVTLSGVSDVTTLDAADLDFI